MAKIGVRAAKKPRRGRSTAKTPLGGPAGGGGPWVELVGEVIGVETGGLTGAIVGTGGVPELMVDSGAGADVGPGGEEVATTKLVIRVLKTVAMGLRTAVEVTDGAGRLIELKEEAVLKTTVDKSEGRARMVGEPTMVITDVKTDPTARGTLSPSP